VSDSSSVAFSDRNSDTRSHATAAVGGAGEVRGIDIGGEGGGVGEGAVPGQARSRGESRRREWFIQICNKDMYSDVLMALERFFITWMFRPSDLSFKEFCISFDLTAESDPLTANRDSITAIC